MIQTRFVLDAYLDANIVLACAWLVWLLARLVFAGAGLGRAWDFRLHMLQGAVLVVAISPFLAQGLAWLLAQMAPQTPFRLADLAVAQYLDGNLSMRAEDIDGMLGLRARIVDDLAHLRTPLAMAVAGAWLAGVSWFMMRGVRRTIRLLGVLRNSYLWRRAGPVELRLSDRVRVPFSTRVLTRRIIFLPAQMLARPDHMRIAVAHEFEHMRRADVEWEFVLELLRPLFFFNPAFVMWKREIEELRELSCDASLLRQRRVTPGDYLRCLLQVCEDGLTYSRHTYLVTPQVPLVMPGRGLFGRRAGEFLRRRVLEALQEPHGTGTRRLPTVAGIALLTVVISLSALTLQRPADWSQDRLMLSTIVNLERLEARNAALARLANY